MPTIIHRNEFTSFEEASAAIAEFPFCGTCKRGGLKIAQIDGYVIALCTIKPGFSSVEGVLVFTHDGIRKGELG